MVSSNNAINNTVGASISGVTNTLTVTNPSNTASSAARTQITVGGGSAGDPSLNFNINGVTNFEMGIDNNASDSFKISASSSLGTTDTFIMTTAGERTLPLQPAFLGLLSGTDTNVTGDNTTFTIGSGVPFTEIFDRGNNFTTAGVFTAPVQGLYQFNVVVQIAGFNAAHTQSNFFLIADGVTYRLMAINPFNTFNPGGGLRLSGSILVPMTATSTAYVTVSCGAGTKTVSVIGTSNGTSFSGYLVA